MDKYTKSTIETYGTKIAGYALDMKQHQIRYLIEKLNLSTPSADESSKAVGELLKTTRRNK